MENDKPQMRYPGIRTFECVVPITGWPKNFPDNGIGSMDDLPPNLQDGIMQAMERKSVETGLPLMAKLVRVDVDHDKAEDAPGRYFLHVILSEVVAVPELPKGMLN